MQGVKLTWSISIFFKQIDKRSADKIQSKKYWGPFKYYAIRFLTFLGPLAYLFDDLKYCKSSKIAIFWPHLPTSLMT